MRSNNPLPIIVSLPHGGMDVPAEVRGRLAIDETVIYNECDLWVEQLYHFADASLPGGGGRGVLETVSMPVARVLIDANRPPDALENPDGPVKTQTSYGQPIYTTPLTDHEQEQLRERYWQPFHTQLATAFQTHGDHIKFFLDGHNMAQLGPAAYADGGRPRPLILLANFGDLAGAPKDPFGWTSCTPTLLRAAGKIAEEIFVDMTLLEPAGTPPPVVGLNAPFHGGYVLSRFAGPDAPVPGVPGMMVEINRGLFVGNQRTDTPVQPPNLERIAQVRERLYLWMARVLELL